MAIAFRAEADSVSSGTSIVIGKPTGTVDNDAMIAIIAHFNDGNTVTCSPPSGWTEIASSPQHGYWSGTPWGMTTHIYWKKASSEGSDYTFTLSRSVAYWTAICSYSGCDTTNPIDVQAGFGRDDTASATVEFPNVTLGADEWVIVAYGMDGSKDCTIPTGYTVRFDHRAATPVILADSNGNITAGSYTPPTATITGSQAYGCFTVGLKPAVAAGSWPLLAGKNELYNSMNEGLR